jgi:hypothetical protein
MFFAADARKTILSAYDAATALSDAECAGNLLGL